MNNIFLFPLVSLLVSFSLSAGGLCGQDDLSAPKSDVTDAESRFAKQILPLLEKYCIDCHAPGEMAGLDFLDAKTTDDVAKLRGLYAVVVEQMETRVMPPKNLAQPTESERNLVTDWLKKTLELKPRDIDRVAPYVVATYEDSKGNLWFGTISKGAARYDGKTLEWFSKKDGLPSNVVTSFAEDEQGNLWLGTHSGVCKYDGKNFTIMWTTTGRHDQGEGSMGVRSDRAGNIWTSTNNGVFRFSGAAFTEFKLPIVKETIASHSITAGKASLALEDRSGNLWFKTDGYGALKFDGDSFDRFTKKDGLCSDNVTSIMEDKRGNIWFACIQSFQPRMTGDGGVCRYDGKTFTKFPNVKGLSNNDVYTIYQTRAGDIWIGASGVGAYRYDGKTFDLFRESDRAHSLRNFGLQSMLEANNGTLWFGFSGGLFRFNGRSFFNITKEGPWDGLAVAMSKVITGANVDASFIHADTRIALAAMAKGKFDQAKTVLLELKHDDPSEVTIQERSITMLGYQLMSNKRIDLAIEVFKLNTYLHPQHFNAFDSLGEAYLRSGNDQLAFENYNKSLELNPKNTSASDALTKMAAGKKYKKMLIAPHDWMEEVLIVPPGFAPTMGVTGTEHLRLPPDFRDKNSDWFCSYLFAIDLTEPARIDETAIAEQLLIYFRGLAAGGLDKDGKQIETSRFSIAPQKPKVGNAEGEYLYTLHWQEPFVDATQLKQNIRVNAITDKNQYGVLFVCASPQSFDSSVWTELSKIRSAFLAAPVESKNSKPDGN